MDQNYDAILIVSFGGPEGMEDVIPFLENVLRGKNVPRERMLAVARHYERFGGVSPINEQNRNLIAALNKELASNGLQLPVYWGNRNWHPMLVDTLRQMANDDIKQAIAFVTSAYSSYSGCRQYLEDIERARAIVGDAAPRIDKIRAFYNHPLFIEVQAQCVLAQLQQIPEERRSEAQVAFTAHSIPLSMAVQCDYQKQLEETCRLVAETINHKWWQLVFQSRSGSPKDPWLEPDICDHIQDLNNRQPVRDLIIAPIGFLSDHMEVKFDLDIQAKELAQKLGVNFYRAATPGTHPSFIKMIRELILERCADGEKRFCGRFLPATDQCLVNCCRYFNCSGS